MNVRQFSLILPCFALLLPASTGLLAGCGDSGSGGSGGGGGGPSEVPASCEGVDLSGCDVVLGPVEGDDTTQLQGALIEDVKSGETLCLCPGTYELNNEVQVSTPDLTIRGVGATRDDVVLDFAEQIGGDDGLTATTDGFTVENFSVKNSPGNGIVVTGAENVTFRNLHVYWDAGSVETNGAYAVYPVQCTNVLIEDCEIVGAADAGAYVGQSTNIIVRNNLVHGNVAGIEIENSNDAEVYGNEAYDNSAGILVFALPNLDKKDSLRCDVHDNQIYDNNRENFAAEGIVGAVPPGIGVLILAAHETHVHDNNIHDNQTGGIVLVGHDTLGLLVSDFEQDPQTDPDPESTYIYGNTFDHVGYDPADPISAINETIEEVLWDGIEKTAGSANLCLSMDPPTFRNINGLQNLANPENHSTDTTPFECDLEPLPAIEL